MASNVIFILVMFFSNHNLCWAQTVAWHSNNFKDCIKMGLDNFTMKAVVKRTTSESFITRNTLFEIKSANNTFKTCIVSNFSNCGQVPDECYCSKQTSNELHIIFSIKSNISLIGNIVTVRVSCAKKEETLVSKELVITYFNDTPTVFKMGQQKYDLSKQFLFSKVPVLIEFCCENLEHCKAFIQRNDEIIDNGSYCVSFNETSHNFVNYKIFWKLCNQTIKKGDMLFISNIAKHIEVQNGKETGSKEEIKIIQIVMGICITIFAILAVTFLAGAIYLNRHNKKQDVKIQALENKVAWMEQEIDNIKRQPNNSKTGEDLDVRKLRGKNMEEIEMSSV